MFDEPKQCFLAVILFCRPVNSLQRVDEDAGAPPNLMPSSGLKLHGCRSVDRASSTEHGT